MSWTLSWHQGGQGEVHQAHNRREPSACGNESEIDLGKTKDNIILIDIPVRAAYANIFGSAVEEYNSRTRADRQIKDYYSRIDKSDKQHTAYEAIVQIGSKAEGVPERASEALEQYVREWDKTNPNLRLIGAYIHRDEASIHLHLDYIPVAECTRGMRLQNSLTKALGGQGFSTAKDKGTAQQQWQQSERDRMRGICAELGIDLKDQGKGRQYMSIKEYKQYADSLQDLKKNVTAAEAEQGIAITATAELQAKQAELQININKQDRQIAENKDRISKQNKQISDNQNRINKQDRRINNAEEALKQKQLEVNEQVLEKEAQIATMDCTINSKRKQVLKVLDDYKILKEGCEELQERKDNLTADTNKLQLLHYVYNTVKEEDPAYLQGIEEDFRRDWQIEEDFDLEV